MWRICLFQLIAWVAWFEYQIYISAWVGMQGLNTKILLFGYGAFHTWTFGWPSKISLLKLFGVNCLGLFIYPPPPGEDVYSGDASAKDGSELKENYDEGVRWTSLCLAVNAAVVLVYSVGVGTFRT